MFVWFAINTARHGDCHTWEPAGMPRWLPPETGLVLPDAPSCLDVWIQRALFGQIGLISASIFGAGGGTGIKTIYLLANERVLCFILSLSWYHPPSSDAAWKWPGREKLQLRVWTEDGAVFKASAGGTGRLHSYLGFMFASNKRTSHPLATFS